MNSKKYTISETAQITGYPNHVLRFYEKEFNLNIPRNSANHRYYTIKEIEIYQYIKHLQEKGLTNKQIKLILDSPQIMKNHNIDEETAITTYQESPVSNNQEEMSLLMNHINDTVNQGFGNLSNDLKYSLDEVMAEIHSLKEQLVEKDQDIILCENAKLKMKVKQKSYEIAELKEQLKRERNKKKSLLEKIFKK